MAYRKWQKKKTSLSIEELTKQSEGIVGVDNVNRTNLGRTRIESLKVYGTTLVNLLGKYGNFENDSNSDGLADGWINDAGLTAVVNAITTTAGQFLFGSKAQKITLSADGEGGNYIEVSVAAAQKLFVSGYIRAGDTSTTGKLIVDWRDIADAQISTDTVGTRAVANYGRVSALLTAPANTVKARIYIAVAGVSGKLAYFDGIQVHNLTAQGTLDSIRAAKYSETNWSDLTNTQLEAEIPYFDSVMSVNVEDGTASELTVENRGKNLFGSFVADSFGGNAIPAYGASPILADNGYLFIVNSSAKWLKKTQVGTIYTLSFDITPQDGAGFTGTFHTPIYINTSVTHKYFVAKREITFTATTAITSIAVSLGSVGGTMTGYYLFHNFQLEESSSATDYVPPRTDSITIPDTVELHGYNGVFNTIDDSGNFVKNWERAGKTTDVSGAFSLTGYATGSKVICRNKTNGEVEVLDAAASVTTSWTEEDIEILYRLATAVSSSVAIRGALGDLHRVHNNFIYSTQTRESFTGDGYTTVFNTTITPKSVKVNGLAQTSGVTLGASSVTFTTAPRRKAIIEVFGAGTGGVLPAINLEILDASGTSETIPALVDLTVTENEEKTGYLNVNGAALKVVGNKTYTVTVNKDLIESQDNVLEEYRDKKFRLKVANSRDSSEEYLSVCHIDPDASLDYLNGTENIVIKCGDLYD